ncbi:MAG: hypothetical protein KDH88_18175 [Chromatiales bacterium]|nr:hypothetical protein [Chromatiales bacterium]
MHFSEGVRGRRRFPLRIIILLSALFFVPCAWTIESLKLDLGRLVGPDWAFDGVTLVLRLSARSGLAATITVREGRLPAPIGDIKGLSLHCPSFTWKHDEIHCSNGKASLRHGLLDQPEFGLALHYAKDTEKARLALTGLHLLGGFADLNLTLDAGSWRIRFDLNHLNIERAAPWLPMPEEWSIGGKLSTKGEASGSGTDSVSVQASGVVSRLGLQNTAGTVATEGLNAPFNLLLAGESGRYQGQAEVELNAGAAYVDPVYIELAAAPLRVAAHFDFGANDFQLTSIDAKQAGILSVGGNADLALSPGFAIRSAKLQANIENLTPVGSTFINPWLVAGPFEGATWQGRVQLHLDMQGDEGHFNADVRQLGLRDARDHLRLEGMDGQIRWNLDGSPARSWLFWKELGVYGLVFGGARLDLEAGKQFARLLRPAEFALFDGALRVNDLQWEDGDQAGPTVVVDGVIRPVSLERITEALGVTRFGGTLSAVIPNVRLQNRLFTVNGALLLSAFGGDVVIRGLKVDKLLGPLPVLEADVELKNLDLEALTRTFSFGKITGRIAGFARGLRLEAWLPVAFDARLATPEDDDSRHRISQRAVDTLTNVGGSGVAGALSRTYLSFFEDFAYDRIGLSCRLRKGICEMGGVLPADNGGYYIVKGGGLPRIDIIGFNRRVDWDVFLTQLRSAATAGSPDIR